MSTTTSTLQTTYSGHQHNQRTEHNDLTLPTDRNWPITTDEHYLSLTANNITAKLTNQFSPTRLITFDWQTTLSLDSDDDFRSGCRNVSHCHRQQSFSGLPSPGRSHYTIEWNEWSSVRRNSFQILGVKGLKMFKDKIYQHVFLWSIYYLLLQHCTSSPLVYSCKRRIFGEVTKTRFL